MKHVIFYFCVLLFCTSCEQSKEQIYVPTRYDQLDFLVANSDLIAVIDILDGYSRNTSDLKNNKDFYRAKIIDTTLPTRSNEIISIDIVPYYNSKKEVVSAPVLRKGLSLAFLKRIDANKYKPLTDLSIITIYGTKISPVWKQVTSSDMFGIFEFNIDDIRNEIVVEIKNQKR